MRVRTGSVRGWPILADPGLVPSPITDALWLFFGTVCAAGSEEKGKKKKRQDAKEKAAAEADNEPTEKAPAEADGQEDKKGK